MRSSLLLLKGAKDVSLGFRTWLAATFDCTCASLVIPPHKLDVLAADLVVLKPGIGSLAGGHVEEEQARRSRVKPFEFEFALPETVDGLDTMTINVPADAIHDLERRFAEDPNIPAEDVPVEVHRAILTSLIDVVPVRLTALALVRIANGAAMVSRDGKVKLFSLPHALPALTHLMVAAGVDVEDE